MTMFKKYKLISLSLNTKMIMDFYSQKGVSDAE